MPDQVVRSPDGAFYWDGTQWIGTAVGPRAATPGAGTPGAGTPGAGAPPVKAPRGRQQMIDRAEPLLPPGAQIRQIFPAGTKGIGLFVALVLLLAILPGALLFALINRNRLIAVTQDAIYVLDCGHGKKPKRVLMTLPRPTHLGSAGGMLIKITAGPETLWVAQRFAAELAAADAGVAQTQQTVPAIAMSPDRNFWWDGARWIDCAQAAPQAAPRSPDGNYWWDGVNWRAVPGATPTGAPAGISISR